MKNLLLLLTVLSICLLNSSCLGKKEKEPAPAETTQTAPAANVKTAPLTERDFVEYLTLKGTIEAKNKASVSARVGGSIKEVLVEKGDSVKAGQILFTIDDASYRDKVAVAKATLQAQTAAVEVAKAQAEKAQANLHKASLDVERFRRLYEKKTVSSNELETYTLHFESAKADFALAESNVAAQEAQVELAKASLAICQKDLDDCVIRSPLDGAVSARFHDPGEEVAKKDTILTIVDSGTLRATASIPAEYYDAVQPGKSILRITQERQTEPVNVLVTDKNPVIEEGLRTFELRAQFSNDGAVKFVPGALVNIAVELKRSHGLGVDISVPVRRTAGVLLYTVENGKAKAIPVQMGISQDGMVEVSAEELTAELPIIVEGQYMIQDGDAVTVQ